MSTAISLRGPVSVADTSLRSFHHLACRCNARLCHHVPATLGKRTTSEWPASRLSTVLDTSPFRGQRRWQPKRALAAASRFAEAPSQHVRLAPSLMGKHRQVSSSTSTLTYSGRACEASNTRAAAEACGGGPTPQSFPRCSARMWVARRRLCGDYQHCICPSWPNEAHMTPGLLKINCASLA